MYEEAFNFNEWLEQLDFSVHEGTSIREVKEALLSEFSQELYWLTGCQQRLKQKIIFLCMQG